MKYILLLNVDIMRAAPFNPFPLLERDRRLKGAPVRLGTKTSIGRELSCEQNDGPVDRHRRRSRRVQGEGHRACCGRDAGNR